MDKLVDILNSSSIQAERIHKISKEVKKDKRKITNLAEEYNSTYEQQIREGTKKRQLLLEDGKKQGLSESQVLNNSGFIPSIYTPILNWLFFFMNEHKNKQVEDKRQKLNEQIGHMTHKEVEVMESSPELFEYLYGNITLSMFSKLKKLKSLSRSSNEHEAFRAYRKCLTLCKEHKIDFDKIPI